MSTVETAHRIAAQFDYGDTHALQCLTELLKDLNLGIQQVTETVSQFPTYVTRIATGTEKGLALAVDLGGTNLRVCSVNLHGDSTCSVEHLKAVVPPALMVASHSSMLFSFIAAQVKTFLETYHAEELVRLQERGSDKKYFVLGFAFSFPVLQTGINSGTLLRWTKGFDMPDAVGQDVCNLLQIELKAMELPVKITALINDTVGTIMSRAYSLPPTSTRTTIGAIFGTGTNGVYMEKISNITKRLVGEYNSSSGEMFVSTDWGSFDNGLRILPDTPFDRELDKYSVNPGFQIFEKRVSGMFLGELLRLALVSLQDSLGRQLFVRQGLSKDAQASPLNERWTVDSSILSIAEADESINLQALRTASSTAFRADVSNITTEELHAVKIIAHAIGKRAARLAGMAVSAVILKSGGIPEAETCHQGIDIAVDGSVIEFYPGFESYIREVFCIVDGIGEAGEKEIMVAIAKDGSSVGAAITALLSANEVHT